MLVDKIDKDSIVYYKDLSLTLGKERNTSRWWCCYEGLGAPKWVSVAKKEVSGVIVLVSTLKAIRGNLRAFDHNQRYAKELLADMQHAEKCQDKLVNSLFKLSEDRIPEKVKFLFSSTDNIVDVF